MLPLTAGFLHRRPDVGYLSDRYGPRPFATAGLLVAGVRFIGLMLLPIDFPYWVFALLIFGNGIGSGLFASPNTSAIMSSVPASHRGAASGMRSTFQNSGMSLSIGIFFSLMIAGLAAHAAAHADQRAARRRASRWRSRPPRATCRRCARVFSALLGYNPVQHLLGPVRGAATLPAHNVAVLTGKQFFPNLISGPFHHGLIIVFSAAAAMSLVGVAGRAASAWFRGRQCIFARTEGHRRAAADASSGPGAGRTAPARRQRGPAPVRRWAGWPHGEVG